MKRRTTWKAALLLAAAVGTLSPTTALAASVDFSRTEEEWARLSDNRLEYGEIADLICEYNSTVQNSQYEYFKFIRKYGKTHSDIYDSYREAASDLEDAMSGDSEGMGLVTDLQLQTQADSLREQAEDNLEDSRTYLLKNQQEADSLALSARQKFITYYRKQIELESAKETKKDLENDYALLLSKRQAGTATEDQVLSASESVMEQEKTVTKLSWEAEDTRQSLIVMLGWNGSDQPEIGELPEITGSEMDGIDLEADLETAVNSNFTLKINELKLDNASAPDTRDSLERTIESNRKQIRVSVNNSWQSLNTARLTMEQAVEDEAAEERNMELAEQKWSAGMITKYEYEAARNTLKQKQYTAEMAKLDFLTALETYRADVKGLAAAG